ncbi:hypothetical protein DFJ58DRAFT_821683 [Suillus subalutaceus]|uniref:uncharacterized protein n=1 Tax=Suillus subalutaceus TaxID=48586 RepID=UPI001B8672EC|nr:uncharacterized protein DFJ58DRAFT_821683 [Suillus subalutaceus]KAG1834297.1 hypothetical protein DFJ58DRAFT_821683 [Suillus subalutaceus]
MRVSFVIVLAVAASLISATPIDASAQKCPFFCWIDINCEDCTASQKFPFCTVSCVSAFTSYGRWHRRASYQ